MAPMRNPALAFRPDPGTIPVEPGCYLWRDRNGRVVYVGKAKSLRARLSNYFADWGGIPTRTRAMLEAARSVEWIVTANEVEALHLEYNLIKRHRPRYNVRYTDDKSYPYLAITVQDEVPRAMVRRNPRKDGTRYFGPYAHAYAIRETLDLLLRVFPVRTCSDGVFARARRADQPCLLHHIGRCAAPCTLKVTPEEHRDLVEDLMAFLEGDTAETLDELEARMRQEAAKQNFEAAARIRDQVAAVRRALERQVMATERPEDFIAVHFHADDLEAAFQAFFVKRGRVVGRKGWHVDKVEDLDDAELMSRFVLELAMEVGEELPLEILVPLLPTDWDVLQELLTEQRCKPPASGPAGPPRTGQVKIKVPQRGDRRAFLETIHDNAVQAFQQSKLRRAKDFNARSQALQELQEALELKEPPLRIECYDISTLQGTDNVASMVVMEDGLPRKSEYRRFKIRWQQGQDDFAAMHEVITRRFRKLQEEEAQPISERTFSYRPNLVIIDGGKGQLAAARRALDELGEHDVELCSLAKRFEELYLPDRADPVALPRGSEALYLVQRVRDEAHRFAVSYHRTLRGKRMTSSALDDLQGVGPARRKALLKHFGSVKRMREATVEEFQEVAGISGTLARRIYDQFHRPPASPEPTGPAAARTEPEERG